MSSDAGGPARTFVWAAEPETPDRSVREATGRHWEEWVALIDAGPGRQAGHTVIAAWVHAFAPELTGWWAQGVAVGYERITGLRMPGQMPDGTFTVSRSRLLSLPVEEFRAGLLDEARRRELLPGLVTALRSKPASKSLRFTVAEPGGDGLGTLMFTTDPVPGDRCRLTVTHEKLADTAAAEAWKRHWADWLAALPAG
ncbi:MAG: hypothetical protein Q7T71_12530 [Herbiconiux sp.]|nr:hypothetical protein [Herbiconiux sp.]